MNLVVQTREGELSRLNELRVRHGNRVERPFDLFDPEFEEAAEHREVGEGVGLLEDKLLQNVAVVGHAVDDLRSHEAKAPGCLDIDQAFFHEHRYLHPALRCCRL
jgi:hypothetical protein